MQPPLGDLRESLAARCGPVIRLAAGRHGFANASPNLFLGWGKALARNTGKAVAES